jgi:riboflavin kinase/FMN adenylyltransferase
VKIYYSIEDFQNVSFPVLTTGTFDGVHLGHKTILDKLNSVARENDGESVLLTFSPHPRIVLFPEQNDLKLLTTREEKIELLEHYGVDHLIIHPFTKEFSRLSSVEFIRDLLVNQLQIKKLVIGYNHHFGRNREGSLEHLLECGPVYGFDVEEIPAADIDNVNVSSTKIRKALHNGDLSTAKSYLGHDYSLAGEVVKGEGRGTGIGYPTANIQIENPIKLIPANGVYAVYTTISDTQYQAMMNIGVRPTVTENSSSPDRTIEINIFDFDQDIYGEAVRVTMVEKIRDEVKFDSVKELAIQLADDKESALNLLNKN